VDVTATLDAPCGVDELFSWVDDLNRYAQWLSIIASVTADGDDAWMVNLRGRFGPFARSKRLRMRRTTFRPDAVAVFERDERDGRQHSPWVLRADVAPSERGSRLTMNLHYGGGLWGPVLEAMLRSEIDASRDRLLELVSG
jgi:Polyketide cyclase / dehydrase and lipid transport